MELQFCFMVFPNSFDDILQRLYLIATIIVNPIIRIILFNWFDVPC